MCTINEIVNCSSSSIKFKIEEAELNERFSTNEWLALIDLLKDKANQIDSNSEIKNVELDDISLCVITVYQHLRRKTKNEWIAGNYEISENRFRIKLINRMGVDQDNIVRDMKVIDDWILKIKKMADNLLGQSEKHNLRNNKAASFRESRYVKNSISALETLERRPGVCKELNQLISVKKQFL